MKQNSSKRKKRALKLKKMRKNIRLWQRWVDWPIRRIKKALHEVRCIDKIMEDKK